MKRFNWLLIGLVVLCLAMVPLAGCVAKSEYEALQAENAALVEENTSLKAELAEIKEKGVYSLGQFPSIAELTVWAQLHMIPCPSESAAERYRAALKVQERAVQDGYMVSAVITPSPEDPELYIVWCTAFADGNLYWWNPADGIVHLFFTKDKLEL